MFSANTSQVSGDKLYVEDVFSTYLYSGTSANQTINNGIDLAGKGGLVWIKCRNSANNPGLYDTARGVRNALRTSDTSAQYTASVGADFTAFNSNGFSVSGTTEYTDVNVSGSNLASWTFRKAPKFFDVVTYTGNGTTQSISHNLGTAPGTIIVKSYGAGGSWIVYHQSLGAGSRLFLNATNAATTTVPETVWGNNTTTVAPTSTAFTTGSALNSNGDTYVAYLFAHDTTSDGIIQCGSFTTDGSGNATVNLGWEPQWAMVKRTDSTSEWFMNDNMRGMPATGSGASLYANRAFAEDTSFSVVKPTATGFTPSSLSASATYIYIAIRRGPMRTPTSGTSVFKPTVVTNTASVTTTNFPVDLSLQSARNTDPGTLVVDRMRGTAGLVTFGTNAENGYWGPITGAKFDNNTGVTVDWSLGASSYVNWSFRRAPSFFDVVCWTGNGVNPTSLNHNLGVAPELIITKKRNSTSNWITGYDFTSTTYKYFFLNETLAATSYTYASSPVYGGNPTSSVFIVGNQGNMNISGDTYVSYLFASCPGVSKVGSYTGNGSSQTINCGFAAGARFVMIKRTGSTGDWYVWDTARGIVAGNDPRLSLNSTAAEVTTDDSVDTDSSGFVVNQLSATNINVNAATYLYMAVA